MRRVFFFTLVICLGCLQGCNQTPQSAAPANTNATNNAPAALPTPQPSASVAAVAAPSASTSAAPALPVPAPGSSIVPPIVADEKASKNAKGKNAKDAKAPAQQLPPAVWERLTRPLSLEEINKLPPETRDMILKAQGRYTGPPTPTPKK